MCIRWLWFYDVFIITKIFFLTLLVAAFLLHVALSLKHSDVGWKKTAGNLLALPSSIFLGAEQYYHSSSTLGHELLLARVGLSLCGDRAQLPLLCGWMMAPLAHQVYMRRGPAAPPQAAGCAQPLHSLGMPHEGPQLSAIWNAGVTHRPWLHRALPASRTHPPRSPRSSLRVFPTAEGQREAHLAPSSLQSPRCLRKASRAEAGLAPRRTGCHLWRDPTPPAASRIAHMRINVQTK